MANLRLPDDVEDAAHAIQRLIERNVSWPEVEYIVDFPHRIREGHTGRTNFFGVINGRGLRITLDDSNSLWTVTLASEKR